MISNTPNYTMEYLSERVSISHDKLRGILKSAEISSKEIRERSNKKCKKLIFDDTVLDKRYSKEIELAKHLWDNCEKRVIEGIGLISAISVNEMNEFDLADYRLYDKINDGKTKNDHFQDMLRESDADDIMLELAGICTADKVTVEGIVDTRNAKKPISTQVQITGKTYQNKVSTSTFVLGDETTMSANVNGTVLGYINAGIYLQQEYNAKGIKTAVEIMPRFGAVKVKQKNIV